MLHPEHRLGSPVMENVQAMIKFATSGEAQSREQEKVFLWFISKAPLTQTAKHNQW